MLAQQLVPEDLARLTTAGHSINVEVRKRLLGHLWIIAIREDIEIAIEDGFQEVILDI